MSDNAALVDNVLAHGRREGLPTRRPPPSLLPPRGGGNAIVGSNWITPPPPPLDPMPDPQTRSGKGHRTQGRGVGALWLGSEACPGLTLPHTSPRHPSPAPREARFLRGEGLHTNPPPPHALSRRGGPDPLPDPPSFPCFSDFRRFKSVIFGEGHKNC